MAHSAPHGLHVCVCVCVLECCRDSRSMVAGRNHHMARAPIGGGRTGGETPRGGGGGAVERVRGAVERVRGRGEGEQWRGVRGRGGVERGE